MKTIISFFLIITVSVATEVKLYVYHGYEFYGGHKTRPVPTDLFRFSYHSGDVLSMHIYLSIIDLNVTADLYVQYQSGVANIQKNVSPKKSSTGNQYFEIRRILNDSEIVIDLELNTRTGLCTRKQIVKGIKVSGSPGEANSTLYNNICLKTEERWVIEVDLLNDVNTRTVKPRKKSAAPEPSSTNSVIPYVVPSVIVICVIILVTYLSVKKYCPRNSRPVHTMELNTYATANEVVYADLSLVHGDRQPPRRDEESPYAEIIGVIKSC